MTEQVGEVYTYQDALMPYNLIYTYVSTILVDLYTNGHVQMKYHVLLDIFRVNMQTLLHFIKLLCITNNLSPRQFMVTECDPSVLNEIMLTHCQISR